MSQADPPVPAAPRIGARGPLLTTWDDRLGRAHGRGAARSTAPGLLAALLARGLGLPTGRLVPAELTVESTGPGERWTRRFGRRRWSTTCERTATGIIEWVGPVGPRPGPAPARHRHRHRRLLGLDLAVTAGGGPTGASARLRGVRLGRWMIRRPPGLDVVATTVERAGGLVFATTVSLAGRPLVAYEGWIR
jgi:hypothetical protein